MPEDGHSAEWDDVGRRFGELGRRLQSAWAESRPESSEEGGHTVVAALEDLKASIGRTVSDPDVRQAAGAATTGFTDALATSLRQLADWIERRPPGDDPGGDTVDGGPPAPPADV